jgi:putative oxidoreductase
MKTTILIARILLGTIFVVFGLNYWLKFIPVPPPPEGPAGAFIGAMFTSGYLAVVAALQVIGGALMFSRRCAPIGLLILGPIVVNICLFHLLLDHIFNPIAALVTALSLFLLWGYRAQFLALVQPGPTVKEPVPAGTAVHSQR